MNLPTLLSKAKELGEKATPAPWTTERYDADNGYIHFSVNDTEMQQVAFCHEDMHPKTYRKDAAFIAFARTALPLLVRIVERQGEALSIIENDGHSFHDRDLHTDIAAEAIAECEKIAAEITGGREGE